MAAQPERLKTPFEDLLATTVLFLVLVTNAPSSTRRVTAWSWIR
jgi:hypothetical protein